jgi:hypothetical protein
MSLSPGYPAVLAQGLVYVPGGDMVWSVREFDVPALSSASGEKGGAAVFLQRQGAAVIRNDVTGKRARLEAGEAFYRAADDSYTSSADGTGDSVMWSFELVPSGSVADDAFYEGPAVKGLEEATYDLEATRFILQPGDSVELPAYTGTGLAMGMAGEIEVTPDSSDVPTLLREGDGKTLTKDDNGAKVANTGSGVAMFIFVALGDEVSDETAGAGTANQPAPQPTAATSTDTDTSDTTTTTTTTGEFVTSVNVAALAEIYVTITADGTVAYDGYLEAGQSTGPIAGSFFTVQTSSGANTTFTNACGVTFNMGYEEGDAYYELAAGVDSCAPGS